MTTTVLKLSEAAEFLKKISIRAIKDVRALDVDLLFVFANGERIIISGGAMQALSAPDTQLQFADGQLPLGRVFQQIDQINVSPEANLTVSSKEITRYNQNNTKTDKARKQEDESDKPVIVEEGEKAPQATLASSGDAGNTAAPEFSPLKSPDNQQQLADVEINSQHEKNWGVQWPVAAGVLALLAAAGGGGGGGAAAASNAANGGGASSGAGAAGGAASGTGASSQPEIKPTISGAAMLGPLNNATAIAYDDQGHAISAAAQVIDGHYSLLLNKPGYRGTVLVVISDNTPGLPDNYADEATHKLTDLGNTVLRALVTATGASQNVNVTALTELAVIKAGMDVGMANYHDVGVDRGVGAATVDSSNLASINAAVAKLERGDVDTPDKLAALAATASDLIRTARESKDDPVVGNSSTSLSLKSLQALGLGAITSEAVQVAFLDAVRVKGNNIDPATNLPSSADNAATHDVSGVRSIEQLAAIANSYAKVLAYVNGAAGATEAPQLSDYQTIGVAMPHAIVSTAVSGLALLNSAVHAQSGSSKIDSVADQRHQQHRHQDGRSAAEPAA